MASVLSWAPIRFVHHRLLFALLVLLSPSRDVTLGVVGDQLMTMSLPGPAEPKYLREHDAHAIVPVHPSPMSVIISQKVKQEQAHVVKPPFYAYPAAAAIVTSLIVFLYAPRGPAVVFGVLCYVAALSTMKLTLKSVFVTHSFKFAKFVSATHFLSGAIAMLVILIYRWRARGTAIPVPTWKEFGMMLVPVSLAITVSIGASNTALVFCSVAFTEIIGSTNCLVTIAVVLLLGMPFNLLLIIPAVLVAGGCIISTSGEINFSMVGVILCFTANIFRSGKVALQQKLMTGTTKDKFDPCALLFWTSVPCFLMMLGFSLATEGLEPCRHIGRLQGHQLVTLVQSLGICCVNATMLNLAQLFVTKDLGAVGSQLVAQAKSVLTVLGGMVVFGEQVTVIELVGFVVVLLGVYMFSRIEQQGKKDQAHLKAEMHK